MLPDTRREDLLLDSLLLDSLASGSYWAGSPVSWRPEDGCVVSFLDWTGQKFVTIRYAWDWGADLQEVLGQLLFERPLPDCELSAWIPTQFLRRCPPMQVLVSDQPSAHSVKAFRYLAILLFPLSLVVFDYQGPAKLPQITSMDMLEARWKGRADRHKGRESCLSLIASLCAWK